MFRDGLAWALDRPGVRLLKGLTALWGRLFGPVSWNIYPCTGELLLWQVWYGTAPRIWDCASSWLATLAQAPQLRGDNFPTVNLKLTFLPLFQAPAADFLGLALPSTLSWLF